MKLRSLLPRGLNLSLLTSVIGWGLLFTVLLTVSQVAMQFENRRLQVKQDVELSIEKALPGLSASVFTIDEEQLELHLRNLNDNPNIVFVQVTEIRGNATFFSNTGEVESPYDFVFDRTLYYALGKVTKRDFGNVVIFGSYDKLYHQILLEVRTALLSNFLLVLLIGSALMLSVRSQIIKPLRGLIRASSNLSLEQLAQPIRLNRPRTSEKPRDELDELLKVVNETRLALQQELFSNDTARSRAKTLSLSQNTDITRLFQHENSDNLLMSALNNARLYRCSFVAFWISIENIDKVTVTVGDDVRDKALQVFSKRLNNKLNRTVHNNHIEDFDRSIFARIERSDFLAVVMGIDSRVNANTLAKRIQDVANLPIELGARQVNFEVSQASIVVKEPDHISSVSLANMLKRLVIDVKAKKPSEDGFAIEVIGGATNSLELVEKSQ